jgi:hypothetical protein
MTGAQVLSEESNINALSALTAPHLSDEWTDAVMIRAIVSAIPTEQRAAALRALCSLVGGASDTVAGH